MNKKITFMFALFMLLLGTRVYAQEIETIAIDKGAITQLLKTYCRYQDPNPMWQEEADSVNLFLGKVLDQKYSEAESPALLTKALLLLYVNTRAVYEDGTDIERMTKRRYLCFLAIAFLSDEYTYEAFLEDADNTLRRGYSSEERAKEIVILNLASLRILSDSETLGDDHIEDRTMAVRQLYQKLKPEIDDEDFVKDCDQLFGV